MKTTYSMRKFDKGETFRFIKGMSYLRKVAS